MNERMSLASWVSARQDRDSKTGQFAPSGEGTSDDSFEEVELHTYVDEYDTVRDAASAIMTVSSQGWAVSSQLKGLGDGQSLSDQNSNALKIIADTMIPAIDKIGVDTGTIREDIESYLRDGDQDGTLWPTDTGDVPEFMEVVEQFDRGDALTGQLMSILEGSPLEDQNSNALAIIADRMLPALSRLDVEGADDLQAEIQEYLSGPATRTSIQAWLGLRQDRDSKTGEFMSADGGTAVDRMMAADWKESSLKYVDANDLADREAAAEEALRWPRIEGVPVPGQIAPGDVVKTNGGRVLLVESFNEKDGRPVLDGKTLASSEDPASTPTESWAYMEQIETTYRNPKNG